MTISLLALLPLAHAMELDRAERRWLDAHSFPLDGATAGAGHEDLGALADIIGDARVVGLGECTHGSREVFQMKHRLLEYLVDAHGFTAFAIEASLPDTLPLGAWVQGGEGEGAALVKGMGFWTWSTEEVRDMAAWMRDRNASRSTPLTWTGIDLQNPRAGVDWLAEWLAAHDPDLVDDLEALRPAASTMRDFGVATLVVGDDVDLAGKPLKLSGRLRTGDVRDGFAGLWMRLEGPEGKILAFDNMQDRGPTGTTEWTRVEVAFDAEPDAEKLTFGLLFTGRGEAGFDDLELTVGDRVWTPPEAVDLGFETSVPEGGGRANVFGAAESWTAGGTGYLFARGDTDAAVGDGWLRVAAVGDVDHDGAVRGAARLVETLEARHGAGPDDGPWAVRVAETVRQGLELIANRGRSETNLRDAYMAANVAWLAEHTDARIVLWAHNVHVSRWDGWMGAHLAERLGDAYVPVGFACANGTFTARDTGGALGTHPLTAPPADSAEARLLAHGVPLLAVDLRSVGTGRRGAAWLAEPVMVRNLGAVASPRQFHETDLPLWFDLLVYHEQTTASLLLP